MLCYFDKSYGADHLLLLFIILSLSARVTTGQIHDVPEGKGLTLGLKHVLTLPDTRRTLGTKSDVTPEVRARISFLRATPDGREFVNDQRGQIYRIRPGDSRQQYSLFVDIDADNGGLTLFSRQQSSMVAGLLGVD